MRISSKKNYAFYKGKSQEIWLLFGKKKKKITGAPGCHSRRVSDSVSAQVVISGS